MNWLKTPLTERLHIRYPIVQAPLTEGVTTPQLVAAVANAGGLGTLAAGALEPDEIRDAIAQIRRLTAKPFAVNLFAPQTITEEAEQFDRANQRLDPIRNELGLPQGVTPSSYLPDFNEQLNVLLTEQISAVSFLFGAPPSAAIEALKGAGIVTLGVATHLLEAIILEESGFDMIIAQGMEAGGYRGTFVGQPEQGLVGLMGLVPVLVDHIATPVIASGGIMDGRGISAALALGAVGAQLGTAFLCCPESGAHPRYKELVSEGTEVTTMLTRTISGRAGRGLKNRLISELQPYEAQWPGFPIQYALTRDIRTAAAVRNRPEFMALWAGQTCGLCTRKSVGELLEDWVAQVNEILGATVS